MINNGGDRIAFHLDAEPDRNRFDLFARVVAPANGLVPAMIGTRRAMNLPVGGKGSWTRWRGQALLDLSGRPTARLALGVDQGRYRLQGKWAPAQFLTGKFQRLTAPVVDIRGDATLKNRMLDGQLTIGSAELRAVARGALDLASNRFKAMRLGVDLLKPPALFRNMTGTKRAHGVDARWPIRDRRLFVPADVRLCAVRQYRLHRPSCRRPRPLHAVADAGPDPAQRARDHRRRRYRRGDARQSPDRRLADGHAQAGPRRGAEAHQRQVERQDRRC